MNSLVIQTVSNVVMQNHVTTIAWVKITQCSCSRVKVTAEVSPSGSGKLAGLPFSSPQGKRPSRSIQVGGLEPTSGEVEAREAE